MITSILPRLLALLLSGVAVLSLSAEPSPAQSPVDSLYRLARSSSEIGSWAETDRWATAALAKIEAVESKNWIYTGTRKPQEAIFFGDYIMVLVLDEDTGRFLIEIWDPQKDELLRKHDEEPWEFTPFDAPTFYVTENYVFLKLERRGSSGYQLMCFRKGMIEPERRILRDGVLESVMTSAQIGDQTAVLEKTSRGVIITLVDLAGGTCRELHELSDPGRNQKLADYPYKLYEQGDNWHLIDGSRILTIDPRSRYKSLVGNLPFTIRPEDDCWEKVISAVRGDSIYVVHFTSDRTFKTTVIRIEHAVNAHSRYDKPIQISDTGDWLAYNSDDSLRVFRIEADSTTAVYAARSSGKYLRWFGDYLVNSGDAGIQVIKNDRLIYTLADVAVKSILYEDILYLHRAPDNFSAIDLKSGRTLWMRRINLPSYYVNFGLVGYRYLYLNSDIGLFLLDPKTGNDLIRVNTSTMVKPALNPVGDKTLIMGQNFVAIMQIANYLRLKSDLFALQAASKWALNDTTGAIASGRKAISTGFDLSTSVLNYIYSIFDELKQKRELVRLLGRAVIETDDPDWADKLASAGLDFLTGNVLYDFGGYNLYVSQAGVFAYQQIIGSEYFNRNSAQKCYTFRRPKYEGVREMRSFSYADEYEGGIIFYEFNPDSTRQFSYNAFLLDEFGRWKPLGYVLNASPPPRLDVYPIYPDNYPLSQPSDGRALVNYSYKLTARKDFPVSCGIDLSGEGQNWVDTTSNDPIRVRQRCYAHEKYGDLVLKTGAGSQARRVGITEGDIVIKLGGYALSNTVDVPQILEQFPLGTPLDIVVKRGSDTLTFIIFDGPIGYLPSNCYNLVEFDPDNGSHLSKTALPPGYRVVAGNGFGQLVYQLEDTLLFFDPISASQKKIVVRDLKDYRKWYKQQKDDVLIYCKERSGAKLAVDVSGAVDDSARVLWRQSLAGEIINTDDNETFPMLQEGGILLVVERSTGAVVARETLPFKNIEFAQVKDKNLYGIGSGRLFSWRISYYHPPFPWQSMGYGAVALVPLLIATWPVYRQRINKLKKRQLAELQRAEMETELTAARKLQASMMPSGDRILGNYHLVGKFRPATIVGGDYFDYSLLDDGRLMVVIGDVSGHGLPAGILVSMAKASLITIQRNKNAEFLETLGALNEVIRQGSTEKRMFMTLCYLILDPNRGIIGCSANGHPYPLIVRKDGTVAEVEASGGYPLGISDAQKFNLIEAEFNPGETLLLYTDGLPEQVTETGEPWGYEQMQLTLGKLAQQNDLEAVAGGLIERALRYAGTTVQADDMTVVAIRYNELLQNY
ncbi:MAG: SpoIIE family protein phosphatase [bacterium]|nr:SpoIIE family protein phosphatase [bacterium]